MGGYPLPGSIYVYKKHHPQAGIRTASVDLGIIEGPMANEDHLIIKRCAEDEMLLITPYVEPWIDTDEITLEELKDLP